ncbi:alpha/beta fold hydrolase, partial [Nocardia sp. NPDC024068]|uniref:alpha/beta fold hydrolase n=1 Tax=Nocardia sp. NPDC024068 TaxID=3157197 RepID=UPI0033CD7E54
GTVAAGTVAAGTVAAGTVAAGTVAAGTVAAGTVAAGALAAVLDAMAAVLGIDRIGADDDFFAAGGHSLTAVRLVGRLRRAGHEVVVDDVFEAPTARALAGRIDGVVVPGAPGVRTPGAAASGTGAVVAAAGAVVPGSGAAAAPVSEEIAMLGRRLDHVLRLRAAGAGTPLFCVHPVGGTAWQFTPLARRLRADRPLIGLQLPALRDGDSAVATLDDLAARYVATIREIQPEGPYHLLGYSLGGTIAHAMAARLVASGAEVAFVGLVDSHPLANLIDQANGVLADPSRLDELLPELPADAPDLAALIRAAASELLRMVTVSETPRYTGPMALYAADPGGDHDAARVAAQLAGWRAAGARVTARRLPYTHFGIVTDDGWAEVAALLDTDPALRA